MQIHEQKSGCLQQLLQLLLLLLHKQSTSVAHHYWNLKSSEVPDTYTSGSKSFNGSKQIDPEPSYNKWVKHLCSNPLDPIVVTPKRFKIGDANSYIGAMQNLLSRAVNYTRTISDLPEPQQQQQLDRTISLEKNGRPVMGIL